MNKQSKKQFNAIKIRFPHYDVILKRKVITTLVIADK